ncbi:diacylglycerol kinase family protein [Patescibacteria group bacterium]|nr:MAG: diacylglycerol kinase family protein [Patescibacteria group bacterium]
MESVIGFLRSLRTAFSGLVHVVRVERNARFHLVIAVLALLLAVALNVSNAELAAIFFAIIIVFVSEVVNTAIEKILDLIEPNHNQQVRIIKDIAAGAVLVAAVGAAAIGVAVFGPYLTGFIWPLS